MAAESAVSRARSAKKHTDEGNCSVCLHVMIRPKLFPCGHSFCIICARRMHEKAHMGNFEMKCPECRAVAHQKKYMPNFMLQNIIEELRPEDYAERERSCMIEICRPEEVVKNMTEFWKDRGRFLVHSTSYGEIQTGLICRRVHELFSTKSVGDFPVMFPSSKFCVVHCAKMAKSHFHYPSIEDGHHLHHCVGVCNGFYFMVISSTEFPFKI